MDWVGSVLAGVNAALGLGLGLLLANMLRELHPDWSLIRRLAVMIGVYLLECAAIAAGMLIPVFSIALAIIWGIVLGSRLRDQVTEDGAMRFAFYFTAYTCIPMVSLLSIPFMLTLDGRSVINAGEAIRFGIPDFVPWPADTILGFFLCLVVCVCALKSAITLGIVHQYLKPRNSHAKSNQP